MAGTTPTVRDGMLILHVGAHAGAIAVESQQWWLWLEEPGSTSFRFVHPHGTFTARREGSGRYWYAYRKSGGTLHKGYLGKSRAATLARLEAVAATLGQLGSEPSSQAQAASRQPLRSAGAPSLSFQADSVRTSPSLPLLLTKIHMPGPSPHLVHRSHLEQRLTQGARGKLTLLSAPAGSGKSALVSQWLTAEQLPTAWVSLDADDNDPIRFWLYLGASLDALEPALGASVCELLRSPQPPPLPSVVIMLCNALTTLARKCVLVLDDYHVISAPQIHEGLAFLLEHLPPQVHLVLMTRGDPPLPLARLRARGQLSELRSADLRFRLDEAAAFLNAIMGLDLGPDDLTALDAQTEGWIAGLQLAALSLRGRPDASRFIAAFVGSHRFLLDYLSEEVLSRQPQAVQDFLLRTALLDRLSASLCNALTGRDDGQAMLEHLERANLFLIPLDDEQCWYRYHHLFGEFLRDRLRSASANLLPELYQRASALCEREGLLDEAVGYALSAAQLDTRLTAHAADLIERVGYTVWMSGATGTISTWLDRLPIAVVRSRPMLCLARAWELHLTGQVALVEAWLQQAEQGLAVREDTDDTAAQQTLAAAVSAIRALAAPTQQTAERTAFLSERALALLADDSPWRGTVLFARGVASFQRGDDEAAMQSLAEAAAVSKAIRNVQAVMRASWLLASLQTLHGRLRQAAETNEEAVSFASTSQAGQRFLIGWAYVGLSRIHYEWNRLGRAEHYAQEAVACSRRGGNLQMEPDALLTLVRVRTAQGDWEEAERLLEQGEQIVRHTGRVHQMADLAFLRVHLWLARGQQEAAVQWAQGYTLQFSDERDPLFVEERVALARIALAQEQPSEALRMLTGTLALASQMDRVSQVLTLLSLQALALSKQNQLSQALSILARGLSLGEEEGIVHIFIDSGEPMAELLLHLLEAKRQGSHVVAVSCSQDYLLTLLQALGVAVPSSPEAPPTSLLSLRELEVLRLMADGYSDRQIARHLVIAEGTVKTHAKRIYAKLDVNGRTQAALRARALHLF